MAQKKTAQAKSSKSKSTASRKTTRGAAARKSTASRKTTTAAKTKKKAPVKAKAAKSKSAAVAKTAGKATKTKATKSAAMKKATKTAASKATKKTAAKKAAVGSKARSAAKTKPVKEKAAKAPKKTVGAKAATGSRRGKAEAIAAKPERKVPARVVVGASNKTKLASKKLGASRKAAMVAASKASAKAAAARAVAASVARSSAGKKTASPTLDGGQQSGSARQNVSQRHGFKKNEAIVYPSHGVGHIIGIEEQEIAGLALELFVIHFDKEKLTLRVPTGKLESVGMRKLSDEAVIGKAMKVLKGRARIKRTMWSRRAQEYVAKINSGDLISIAEVVRDLYRSDAQPEQSYSERQLYEDALDRMAREVAAVEKIDERSAVQQITDVLSKSARSRRTAEEESSEEEGAADDSQAA